MKFDKIKKEIVIDLVGLGLIFLIFFTFGKVRQESKNIKNLTNSTDFLHDL